MSAKLAISCRTIQTADLDAVIQLARVGFPRRSGDYWANGFRRLSRHVPPAGFPQYGHVLISGGQPVGLHMLISSQNQVDGAQYVRCNVSTWFVREEFRLFAPLLITRATRNPDAAYTSLQPRAETVRVIEAQGFRKHMQGVFAATPSVVPRRSKSARFTSAPAQWASRGVPSADQALLQDHGSFGCIGLWVESGDDAQPLILRRRLTKGGLPCAQIIYYRKLEFLEEIIGPLSRHLALRGMPVILAPASRKLVGTTGTYFPGKFAVYCKGAPPWAACDLSYTEAAIFGM